MYHQVYKKMNQHIHRRCYNQGNIQIVNLMIPWLIDEMTYTNLKFKLGQDESSFFKPENKLQIFRNIQVFTTNNMSIRQLFKAILNFFLKCLPSYRGQDITGWRMATLMARLIAELWSFVERGLSTLCRPTWNISIPDPRYIIIWLQISTNRLLNF